MRRPLIRRVLSLAVVSILVSVGVRAQSAPAQVFQLPAFQRVQLPNGLTLLLVEKHELPLISIEVVLRSGSVADPAGKEGVASLTASLLRKGTATRSSEQFSSDLDFIGMQYNGYADQDATHFSADFLKKDLDAALTLLGDVLLHPTFPEAEVKKKIAQEQDSIRSAKDEAREGNPALLHEVSVRRSSLRPPVRRRRTISRQHHPRRPCGLLPPKLHPGEHDRCRGGRF